MAASCSADVGGEVGTDVGFVGDTAGEGDAGTDTEEPASGCDLLRTEPCGSAETACCAEGQRCTPSVDGTNVCVDVGDRGRGEACGESGFDDCRPGLLCAAPQAGAALECRRLCTESGRECGTGSRCVIDGSLGDERAGLCSP